MTLTLCMQMAAQKREVAAVRPEEHVADVADKCNGADYRIHAQIAGPLS